MKNICCRTAACCIAMFFIAVVNSAGQTPTPQKFKIIVAYASSLMASTDTFVFSLNGTERLTIRKDAAQAAFNRQLNSGESYLVSQLSGPRTCQIAGNARGTIADHDITLTVDCGLPPMTILKLDVRGVAAGESFKFSDNFGRSYTYPFSTIGNLGGYPTGDTFVISQISGPRPCRMPMSQGTVPSDTIALVADCAASPGGTTVPMPGRYGSPELVSRSADGKSFGSFYDSTAPVLGGIGADEGRYVAFVSYAPGLGGSLGKYRQIIWRDRKTGETRLVSTGINGVEGNQNSFAPAISADGLSVAYESYATNLVPVDTNGVRDIFVWNARAGTTTAVSTGPGEIETNSESFEPTISGDGRFIAYSSSASNIAPGVDGTSTVNVYLKDMRGGSTKLITIDPKTKKGVGGSRPSISEDGSKLAFYSFAYTLVEGDKNGLWDIFIYEAGNPKLKRISLTSAGGERDQGDESSSRVVTPSISGDGRYVTYSTTATNVVSGDTNKMQDVFVADTSGGGVRRASTGALDAQGNGDSPFGQGEKIPITFDGSGVAFNTKATNLGGNLIIRRIAAGENIAVSKDLTSSIGTPSMSRTGKCVAFGSNKRLDDKFASSGIFVVCEQK